jgi:hypothetical protein
VAQPTIYVAHRAQSSGVGTKLNIDRGDIDPSFGAAGEGMMALALKSLSNGGIKLAFEKNLSNHAVMLAAIE